jgi:hypothetical protein
LLQRAAVDIVEDCPKVLGDPLSAAHLRAHHWLPPASNLART